MKHQDSTNLEKQMIINEKNRRQDQFLTRLIQRKSSRRLAENEALIKRLACHAMHCKQ
jgi:hypothetical protein